jgi:hypothetical protein
MIESGSFNASRCSILWGLARDFPIIVQRLLQDFVSVALTSRYNLRPEWTNA